MPLYVSLCHVTDHKFSSELDSSGSLTPHDTPFTLQAASIPDYVSEVVRQELGVSRGYFDNLGKLQQHAATIPARLRLFNFMRKRLLTCRG
jgi:hypothetical protein